MSAGFRCRLGDFASTSADEKLGRLTNAAGQSGFTTQHLSQVPAWEAELRILAGCIGEILKTRPEARCWELLLEYPVPRRDKRPDAILIADDLIFVLEFKIGATSFSSVDKWQVLSYALDLRDFHAASAKRTIAPLLIATGTALEPAQLSLLDGSNGLVNPVQAIGGRDGQNLARKILSAYQSLHDPAAVAIDAEQWEQSAYRPSPNIIEAAESLFAGHSVSDISHAFALNLKETTAALLQAIERAQRERLRIICFVTGIPGAGKTLAGLDTVHDPIVRRDDRPAAVFLSGNGPLVTIVREALTRNCVASGARRKEAERSVRTFIANVHAFLDQYGKQKRDQAPSEHAVVFDEAQRAWNATKVFKKHKISQSEPALLLEIMSRVPDWCVVIALVGGGQEINDGEGGLTEWGRALNDSPVKWNILASGEVMKGGASVAGHKLFETTVAPHHEITESGAFHLNVGVRSPRARWLGEWVNQLLTHPARSSMANQIQTSREFPIAISRDLQHAKTWLRAHADRTERIGLLASSGAHRLRAHGIEVMREFRNAYPYAEWFLAPNEDYRSSSFLEVAATEFECQGLELDWTCLCWGSDLTLSTDSSHWRPCRFFRSKWKELPSTQKREFVINKYRVLLTRARKGMVIWVPKEGMSDSTLTPKEFDAVADLLTGHGIPSIDG